MSGGSQPTPSTGTGGTAAAGTSALPNPTVNKPVGTLGATSNQPTSPNETPAAVPTIGSTPTVGFTGATPTTTNGGLLDTSKTPLAGTTTANAQTWNVDPSKQTTSGQLNQILDQNNPNSVLGQAALQGQEAAAQRGLLNSSMGIGAAEQSVINAATPIAQSNAQTEAAAAAQNAQEGTQVNLSNAAATNAAAQQQAGAQATQQLSNQGAVNTSQQFNAQGNLTADQTNAANSMQKTLAQFNAGVSSGQQAKAIQGSVDVAALQGQYSTLINSNHDFSTAFANLQTNITQIASSPNIPNPGDLIAKAVSTFQNYAATMQNITGLDIANNFVGTGAGVTAPATTGTPRPGGTATTQPLPKAVGAIGGLLNTGAAKPPAPAPVPAQPAARSPLLPNPNAPTAVGSLFPNFSQYPGSSGG